MTTAFKAPEQSGSSYLGPEAGAIFELKKARTHEVKKREDKRTEEESVRQNLPSFALSRTHVFFFFAALGASLLFGFCQKTSLLFGNGVYDPMCQFLQI